MIKIQIAGFLSSFQWIAQRWCKGFAMLQESKAIARILRKAFKGVRPQVHYMNAVTAASHAY